MGTTQTQTQPSTARVSLPGIQQAFEQQLTAAEEERQVQLSLWLPMVTGAPDTKATKKA
jgi:hypothetical protein